MGSGLGNYYPERPGKTKGGTIGRVFHKTYHLPQPRFPRLSLERRLVIARLIVAPALGDAAKGWRRTRSATKRWWYKHAHSAALGMFVFASAFVVGVLVAELR